MNNAFISYSHAADGKLAPALQSALEKFAKPWNKIRNLNIFRDEVSLTTSPHLWTTIEKALEDSEFFIYMASPAAAASAWVNKEIGYWLTNRSLETFIIVLTEGDLTWNDKSKTFVQTANNCLPEYLARKYSEEPLYIDLRNLKSQVDLSLDNPIFKKEVLKIAAQLHKKEPKDLAGDEVTAYRKTMRLRNAAVVGLLILFVSAASAAWIANKNAKEAVKQRDMAQANYLVSEAQREATIDPTIALRLAEAAMKKNKDSFIVDIAEKIYRENSFYNTILSEDFSRDNQYRSFIHIAVAPDGKSFVVTSFDAKIKIYDFQGRLLHEFEGHKDMINDIAFSPNGRSILSGSNDGTVRLWDLSGKPLHMYDSHRAISDVSFSPDGNLVVEVSDKVRVLDLNLNVVHEFTDAAVMSAFFSPDSKSILMGNAGSSVLFDLQEKKVHSYEAAMILSAAFSPDQKYLATGSIDSSLKLWKTDGALLKEFKLRGQVLHIEFSRDGSMFLVTTSNGDISLRDTDGNILESLKGHLYLKGACFSPDGKSVLSAGDGAVRLWQLNKLPLRDFAHSGSINSVDFSPDDKKILISSWDYMARIWGVDGKLIKELKTSFDFINSAKFSPTGNAIAVAFVNSMSIYDVNLNLLKAIPSPNLTSIIFSPDGKTILACSDDSTAKLFGINGELVHKFVHKSSVTSASFSPDGQFIFTGMGNGNARLWSIKGEIIQDFKDYNYIPCVTYSPDGKAVVTAGADFTVSMWDLKGTRERAFKGHTARVNSVTLSPDGKYLFTGSADNTAKYWNMDAKVIGEISQSNNIKSVAVSHDGKLLLTGSMNNHALLWNTPKSLSDFLQSKELSELSSQQKTHYGIE